MGAYHQCERRAWYDKAIYDGVVELFGDHASSGYADLGTLIHHATQTKLGCVFPATIEVEPTFDALDSMLPNASTLFKGDFKATERAIDDASDLAAKTMPAAPDGKPWLAEPAYELDWLTGHIDFLSQDLSTIVDLKTTSRKPDHNRVKPPHLVQLCMYYLLADRKPKVGKILYVDSLKASWAILSHDIEFDNPFVADFIDALREKIDWLRSMDTSAISVMPRPGNHCDSDFCPYKAECRDKLIPPAGETTFNTVVNALPKAASFSL